MLVKELQDPNYSFQYLGVKSLQGISVEVLSTSSQSTHIDSIVTPQTWYFDTTSGLPVRIEYRLFDNKYLSRYETAAVDLSEYRIIGGIQYPFQAVRWSEGSKRGTVTTVSVQSNANINPSVFDTPLGGQR